MSKERVFLILQSVVCIALAVLLAVGAVGIYNEGTARKAADPLADVYTAENVAEKLGRIAPAVFIAIGLLIAGILLGVKDPDAEKPVKSEGLIKPKPEPKHKTLIQAVIVVAAVLFIVLGVLNGSAWDVLVKAINICTECVGLG